MGSIACGSEDKNTTEGVSGGCMLSDLCAELTVSQVAAACGTTATSSEPLQESDEASAVRGCSYFGPEGQAFHAQIACLNDGAATAGAVFTEQRDEPQGLDYTQEDLTGVGDRAFFRHSLLVDQAELWVLQGSQIVSLLDLEPADAATTRQCLLTLGSGVLAAN
jgi:hypothetical protein